MERHSCELRLFLDKAKRRFAKAKMTDSYERIVKNGLPENQVQEANTLQIDHMSEEDNRRLKSFLERLIETCIRWEQHELLQATLREALQQSRRRCHNNNLTVGPAGGVQFEPICFFCASDTGNPVGQPPADQPISTFAEFPQAHMQQLQMPATPPPSRAGADTFVDASQSPQTPMAPPPPPTLVAQQNSLDDQFQEASYEFETNASQQVSPSASEDDDDDSSSDNSHESSYNLVMDLSAREAGGQESRASTPEEPPSPVEVKLSALLQRSRFVSNTGKKGSGRQLSFRRATNSSLKRSASGSNTSIMTNLIKTIKRSS